MGNTHSSSNPQLTKLTHLSLSLNVDQLNARLPKIMLPLLKVLRMDFQIKLPYFEKTWAPPDLLPWTFSALRTLELCGHVDEVVCQELGQLLDRHKSIFVNSINRLLPGITKSC